MLNNNFSSEVFEASVNRLTNQLWKLIPMRENAEDWKTHLETVVLEIAGMTEMFKDLLDFLVLLAKLKGLLSEETSFELYRKTVFESISLLRGIRL